VTALPARAPAAAPDRPLPGVDRVLVKLLGTGGFGEVWTARNPYQQSAPVVVLKFCLDEQAAKALRNEAALLDRVAQHGNHPGLVALHQTYLSAVPPCLEYEYVAGGDLGELVRERHAAGGLRPEEVARLMLQTAQAVAFAHERGIVHRDLKPANILVARTAEGGLRLKVADFGIGGVVSGRALARAGGRSHTTRQEMTQALRGAHSPLYASPQQVRAAPPDPRDDVYSLGVIWYQLLTGDLTTGAPSGMSWVKELTGAGVPRSHIDLMAACFEANPAARPADAAELAKQLKRLSEPKADDSPRGSSGKFRGRSPNHLTEPKETGVVRLGLIAGAAAVGVVVLLCGIAFALFGGGEDTGRHAALSRSAAGDRLTPDTSLATPPATPRNATPRDNTPTDRERAKERAKRQERWTLLFNTRDGHDYKAQLKAFGAILAVPDPSNPDNYLVIRDLDQKPAQPRAEDISQIQRIHWTDDKPASVRSLASALGITPLPHFVVFFPQEFEEELLNLELSYRGKKENQIAETRFEVRRGRGRRAYDPVVVSQR
jgi:serine/threonine protein kinase